jgi:hypothetical protein
MSRAERLKRCTTMAEQAQRLAEETGDDLKSLYLDLVVQWLMIASQISKEAHRHSPVGFGSGSSAPAKAKQGGAGRRI